MKILNLEVGKGRTLVIAELCSNVIRHLDNLPNIIKRVSVTGADAIKVQLFKADNFPEAERASKKWVEFPRERYQEFVELCHTNHLGAGASVFDNKAVELVENSGSDFIKLATREQDNRELIEKVNQCGLPVIASFNATIRLGYILPKSWIDNRLDMACTPQYPTDKPIIPRNMMGMGYSSHTKHWKDVLIAVSRGSVAIEKHIGFGVDDPEIGWSLYDDEFKTMVEDIRWAEAYQ